MAKPEDIVGKMMAQDYFSQWLGVEIVRTSAGSCLLKMTIRKEMLNGFGIAHGGIAYSLADSALAFAANGHGVQSLSVETSIAHFAQVKEGDTILAEATEEFQSRKLAHYRVEVFSLAGKKMALFKGVVYRTSKEWSV